MWASRLSASYPVAGPQRVTKRCRLSLLTNSALVIRVQMRGEGEVAGSQLMSTAMHITWHVAQTNFGDLPPYLTYADPWLLLTSRLKRVIQALCDLSMVPALCVCLPLALSPPISKDKEDDKYYVEGYPAITPPIIRRPMFDTLGEIVTVCCSRTIYRTSSHHYPGEQCCESALASLRILIQLFISLRIRIRIQEAKPMRIKAGPDPGQTFKSQKVEFLHEKYTKSK